MQIQQEVESTLESLDGIQRAKANPFLFTRVKAALQKQEVGGWVGVFRFAGKPAVAIAAVAVVLLINLAVFFSARSNSTEDDQQLYANEYVSNSTIIDYENATNQ